MGCNTSKDTVTPQVNAANSDAQDGELGDIDVNDPELNKAATTIQQSFRSHKQRKHNPEQGPPEQASSGPEQASSGPEQASSGPEQASSGPEQASSGPQGQITEHPTSREQEQN